MIDEPKRDRAEWIHAALRSYEAPLVSYAARFLSGDVDRARDVVQETFLRLCREDRERIEAGLREWLYAVCRNKALDVLRKERPMSGLTETQERNQVGSEGDPALRAVAKETQSRVLRGLDRLPDRQRECLRLKFQHGLSYREIAKVMETSVGNVGFLVHVGLKALRERFAGEAELGELSTEGKV